MNATAIARRISMIENTLRNDADVLTKEQVDSLTLTLNGLKAMQIGTMTVAQVEYAIPHLDAAAKQVVAEDAPKVANAAQAFREIVAVATTPEPTPESPKVAAENAKRAAAGKPKMTAAEAKRFEYTSAHNAASAEEACAERFGCECEAYVDIFTFGRWIAQGFAVRKGEKSTRVPVIRKKVVDDVNAPNGKREIKTTSMVPVFCRCQVDRIAKKKSAAA